MKIGFGVAIGEIEKLDHVAVFEEVLRRRVQLSHRW